MINLTRRALPGLAGLALPVAAAQAQTARFW